MRLLPLLLMERITIWLNLFSETRHSWGVKALPDFRHIHLPTWTFLLPFPCTLHRYQYLSALHLRLSPLSAPLPPSSFTCTAILSAINRHQVSFHLSHPIFHLKVIIFRSSAWWTRISEEKGRNTERRRRKKYHQEKKNCWKALADRKRTKTQPYLKREMKSRKKGNDKETRKEKILILVPEIIN